MIIFTPLTETYSVEGLPQKKSREIIEMIEEFSGKLTDMENKENDLFSCSITLPANKLKAVQASMTKLFGGAK